MSTLTVVEEVLREAKRPLSVREIVVLAGATLPSKSKTPDTVVARDLAMDIKKKAEASRFVRSSPGRYTLRAFVEQASTELAAQAAQPVTAMSQSLGTERAGTRPAPAPAAAASPGAKRGDTSISA